MGRTTKLKPAGAFDKKPKQYTEYGLAWEDLEEGMDVLYAVSYAGWVRGTVTKITDTALCIHHAVVKPADIVVPRERLLGVVEYTTDLYTSKSIRVEILRYATSIDVTVDEMINRICATIPESLKYSSFTDLGNARFYYPIYKAKLGLSVPEKVNKVLSSIPVESTDLSVGDLVIVEDCGRTYTVGLDENSYFVGLYLGREDTACVFLWLTSVDKDIIVGEPHCDEFIQQRLVYNDVSAVEVKDSMRTHFNYLGYTHADKNMLVEAAKHCKTTNVTISKVIRRLREEVLGERITLNGHQVGQTKLAVTDDEALLLLLSLDYTYNNRPELLREVTSVNFEGVLHSLVCKLGMPGLEVFKKESQV